MNNFEFFSLIYLMLDSCWEENKNETLGQFMKDKSLGDDNGFQLAKDYLKTVDFYQGLEKYLDEYDQDGWNDAMKQLMNQPHKGDGKS